jgi:uncharacterized membrane protein
MARRRAGPIRCGDGNIRANMSDPEQRLDQTTGGVSPVTNPASRPRLDSIDALRGLVMVLMALDHAREFLTKVSFDPLDLTQTTVTSYFTRWVTHFCAPVFVFLAGLGAFIALDRGRTKPQLSRFLVTRGLWLVLLELTVINWFGWDFSLTTTLQMPQVIWAIGWSMVALAGLIWLPRGVLAVLALAMIAGHNLLDGVPPESFGPAAPLWRVLHAGGEFEVGSVHVVVFYPLIPWPGMMAAGFLAGHLWRMPMADRSRRLVMLGVGCLFLFAVLRGGNLYGNPKPWTEQANLFRSMLAVFNCEKYPPSLAYLLMTLGPALLVLVLMERVPRFAPGFLVTFGRVPMFFYLVHLPLIHGLAIVLHAAAGREFAWLFATWSDPTHWPGTVPGRGFGLPVIYATWLAAVTILFPACRWFAVLKARKRGGWLQYF